MSTGCERETSMLMVKPGFAEAKLPHYPEDMSCLLRSLILASGMEISEDYAKTLTTDEVMELYNKTINLPNIPPLQSAKFTSDLIDYLTSGSSRIIITNGPEAVQKGIIIKSFIRGLKDRLDCVDHIRNIIHAPDPDEVEQTLKTLSKNGY